MSATQRAEPVTAPIWQPYADVLERLRSRESSASVEGDLTGHEDRVAQTTRALARASGVEREMGERMTVAARFHDIGKLHVDVAVLRKTGPFDADERKHMERHASLGAAILSGIEGVDPVMVDGARYHHERYDGHGYEGLSGEDIPLVARIIAIADVHDALVQKRCYKPARPESEVLATMTGGAPWPDVGAAGFDPGLLRTFVAMRLSDPAFHQAEDARLSGLREAGSDPVDVRPGLAAFAASPIPAEAETVEREGPAVP